MDPLHKTDSAISVNSKHDGVLEGQPADDYPPSWPSHARVYSDDGHSSSLEQDSIRSTADSRQETHAVPASVSQAQPQPAALASASASAPASASTLPTMENLITPLDVSNRSPPPPFVPWHQSQLRPPPPPTYAADSGGGLHAPPLSENQPAPGSPSPGPGDHYHQLLGLDALTQAGTGAIDVDHAQLELESDPGYESDRASFASTSLSSSVRDYLFENGRRYHRFREGRYNFPNDEPEQDREDMKHACVKMLCQQQLYFAPIPTDAQNILDIGTGTGIWAIEMGDEFPSANVLGIDLSPIQPDWVPSNVHFLVDDAESEWVHPPDYFDYIHTRHTVMGIKDWPKLYRTALEHIRPGGWMESQEIYHYPVSANNTMPPNHPVAQYWGLINEGLQRLGIDFHACAGGKIAAMMRDAGFENVQERIFHVPLGTWAKHPDLKRVGEYWRHILLEGAQAIALGPLTRGCGWTREQVEVFLIEVRKAYFDNGCLMYMPMYVTYGQKPEY